MAKWDESIHLFRHEPKKYQKYHLLDDYDSTGSHGILLHKTILYKHTKNTIILENGHKI